MLKDKIFWKIIMRPPFLVLDTKISDHIIKMGSGIRQKYSVNEKDGTKFIHHLSKTDEKALMNKLQLWKRISK